MTNSKADAVRIQTSVLNALEKKVLVWLAERQPREGFWFQAFYIFTGWIEGFCAVV